MTVYGDAGLCAHHTGGKTSEWAEDNRRWCNFFHRGVIDSKDEPVAFVGVEAPSSFRPIESYFADPAPAEPVEPVAPVVPVEASVY